MKKHVALTMLALTSLGVLNAHVDLPEVDGRRFVQAQGQLHDVQGWLEDRWTAATRSCSNLESVPADGPTGQATLAAVRVFSPPDSETARLLQLQAQGQWLLAELEFERLNPAVVLLSRHGGTPHIVEGAIWSGSTEPWRPAPLIRRHLRQRAPQAPQELLDCLEPRAPMFAAG